jgi:hypothetical protein
MLRGSRAALGLIRTTQISTSRSSMSVNSRTGDWS